MISKTIEEIQSQLPSTVQVYAVGGCVRDHLLGKPPNDIDIVLVNSTVDLMKSLGFSTVGKDFPVFLMKANSQSIEVALARTEKSTGKTYTDFSVEVDGVTLKDDLMRRDLTINAMAMDKECNIIDLYKGQQHLNEKVLVPVSDAFEEDPVRAFRAARFAAQLGFALSPELIEKVHSMIAKGLYD